MLFVSLSNGLICLTKDLFVVKWFENEKIISQVVGIGKWCDQNGDRVSKSSKSDIILQTTPDKTLYNETYPQEIYSTYSYTPSWY